MRLKGSTGHADRHARRGNCLRGGARGRCLFIRARRYQARIDASDVRRELYRDERSPELRVRLAGGDRFGVFAGSVVGGEGFRSLACGFERMQKIADYYKDGRPDPDATVNPVRIDRQLTFDRLTTCIIRARVTPRTAFSPIVHDTESAARVAAEWQSVHAFCPATCTRWSTRRGTSGCRSTHPTAFTQNVRHHGSYQIIDWVPPEGGGGQHYEGCDDE